MGMLLWLLLVFSTATLYGDSWSIQASSAPLFTSSNTAAEFDLFLTPNTDTGAVLATWSDGNNSEIAVYSFFDGTSWSGPDTISSAAHVALDVVASYNSVNKTFIATWSDTAITPEAFFSIYANGAWSVAEAIPGSVTNTGRQVYNVYDVKRNLFWAAWRDDTTGFPVAGTYDSSWQVAPITNSSTSGGSVFLASDGSGSILAVWVDNVSLEAMYSIYNGSWSSASPIATTALPLGEVTACYDSLRGEFVAVWVDSTTFFPTYAFLQGSTWSPLATIPNDNPSLGATGTVSLSFAPTSGVLLATWTSNMSGNPTYALFNNMSWSDPASITTSSITFMGFNTRSCYNPVTNKFFAGWNSSMGRAPTYSIYTVLQPVIPMSLGGTQKVNNFGIVKERYNTLFWEADPTVTSYTLYRNGEWIATLDGASASYEDHNQPSSSEVYQLIAFKGALASPPASVTIGAK